MILENCSDILDSSFFQCHLPWDSSKHVPEENEICSDEVYNCDLDFCFALLSQDLEFRLVITARKTALELQS